MLRKHLTRTVGSSFACSFLEPPTLGTEIITHTLRNISLRKISNQAIGSNELFRAQNRGAEKNSGNADTLSAPGRRPRREGGVQGLRGC